MGSFFFSGGFTVLFFIMFFLVFGLILAQIIRGIGQWHRNNHSPRLAVNAVICAKRTDTHVHHNNCGNMHSTTYYTTFQVESGDRIELEVSGSEYGMLVEGDCGKLEFQGTRFLHFTRTAPNGGSFV